MKNNNWGSKEVVRALASLGLIAALLFAAGCESMPSSTPRSAPAPAHRH